LARGSRLVEGLKQGQYEPLPVERQVLLIYAVTNGYVDDYPVQKIGRYERELYVYMEANYPEVLESIRTKKEIPDDVKAKLDEALDKLKGDLRELE